MRKVPNTIRTRAENGQNPSQKTLSRYLWNPQKQSFGPREIWPWNTASESLEQQNTSPKASNSKTQAVALEAKSPKHHLDTSRKRPKPDPKNSFTLPLESKKKFFWAAEHMPSIETHRQACKPMLSDLKTKLLGALPLSEGSADIM